MSEALVSVIIPNYNYAKYLRKAVDSVLAQTYPNVEVIVVDDGSTDGSLEVIKSYKDQIRHIQQKNQGVSLARNNGVDASSGEYVAFLDADDEWLPTKLERQMRKFEEEKAIGLVHCSMIWIDPQGEQTGIEANGQEGWVADEFLKFERGVVCGAGSTAIVLKRVFEAVGGFDRRQTTAADWDFSYRVAAKFAVGFVREPLVKYRVHGSNMHSNIAAMEHDMLLGFEKAFAEGAPVNQRECYGNLHKTLSGSYFHNGQYAQFIRHAVKSVLSNPANLKYFLDFPRRRFRRI